MTWNKLANVAAVVVIVWGIAWYVHGVDQDVKSNQEVLQRVQQTQDKIVEWLDQEKQERVKREAERRVFEDLCRQGRLPQEECK